MDPPGIGRPEPPGSSPTSATYGASRTATTTRPGRGRPDRRLLQGADPPPALPRREPAAQPRALHGRVRPAAPRHRGAGPQPAQARRREDANGGGALPQQAPVGCGLPTAARQQPAPRAGRSNRRGGPGRAQRGDSVIQRGRPVPARRHFGSATARARRHDATRQPSTKPRRGLHSQPSPRRAGGVNVERPNRTNDVDADQRRRTLPALEAALLTSDFREGSHDRTFKPSAVDDRSGGWRDVSSDGVSSDPDEIGPASCPCGDRRGVPRRFEFCRAFLGTQVRTERPSLLAVLVADAAHHDPGLFQRPLRAPPTAPGCAPHPRRATRGTPGPAEPARAPAAAGRSSAGPAPVGLVSTGEEVHVGIPAELTMAGRPLFAVLHSGQGRLLLQTGCG